MTTTISNPTMCSWCNCWMHRGEKCWTLKAGKFNEHIHKLLTSICNARSNNIGPNIELMKLLEDEGDDDEDVCLIDGLPLDNTCMELSCKHKFNYLSLLQEIKVQKKYNNLEVL